MKHLLPLCSLLLLLSGCSWMGFGDKKAPPPPTLAELKPAELPAVDRELPKPTLGDIVGHYKSALEIAEEPETRRKIERRLAGLEMLQSEQRQVDGADVGPYYQGAVDLYQGLLENHPDHEGNDRLLYQLAKAYELDGKVDQAMTELNRLVNDYPQSAFYGEAQFRRAELLFSKGNYRGAAQAYQAVIDHQQGSDSAFYRNALYMHGWSQFKRNRYRDSLDSFAKVLDGLIPNAGDLENLPRSKRDIADDSLRVMSLVFSYLDGAKTIAEVAAEQGERHYQHLLYQQLGDLYLDKERYQDSADTFLAFVKTYPGHDRAPLFNVKTIDVYGKGNFPLLVLDAKRNFVSNYGINSDFWQRKSEPVRDTLRPHLHSYLTELAKYQHAEAQAQQKQLNDTSLESKKAKKKPSQDQVQIAFLAAADYYSQFIATFPDDKATPGMVFLMAESLYEGNDLPAAIHAYEQVAYDYLSKDKGAEAGYSAILAYDQYLTAAALDAEQGQEWQYRKIDSAQRFANHYANDKRAVPVLTKSAEQLLALKDYPRAIETARQVTDWQPAPQADLMRTGWLVQGHSQFELQQFEQAELAYRGALTLMAGKQHKQARQQTTERLAATVFKRGEQLLAAQDKAGAVEQLLRIQAISPGSEIAIKGQYDAAAYLMDLAQWQQAENVLVAFRRNHSKHKLAATIPAKLTVVYQEQEKWQPAAESLLAMAAGSDDPEVKRESQYLAAEMYEKAKNWQKAIEHFRDYAHSYPEPFAVVTEARYKMSELYVTTKEPQKRRFWLRKLIDGHKQVGHKAKEGAERSKYLAAFSANVLADDQYQVFETIALKLPLKKSLKKKRAAMEKTIAAYQEVLDYSVQEFATQASFRLGSVYARLSSDLMNSQRPKKLSELELEQYELLLEEQAYPFEETAIDIHQRNAQRSWQGIYDQWVKQSFNALAELMPGRYQKPEKTVEVSRDIY
ncbi:tetratricopeptide repeat protein [Porticoccus sp. W117]|uniref:tetratricopeptide repeat protein n=1 Tax=Porticoccus sp. W117 TaxID=3054777 RepID=UPI0025963DFA|nr:tetratricopeptide repeat protein [Porticoccus sp. W117]MDM3872240.1 tetratricopeptide repeat protein [Porticoccus sp. W117]